MANEKRLIYANALVKIAEKRCGVVNIKHIDEQPTVDAVEVVRCKDCQQMLQKGWCSLHNTPMAQEDFCSYGERINDV